METIFHKILAGDIPCHKVYEDEHVLSFLDIYGSSKGHTLVIPKVFAATILDIPDEQMEVYMLGVKRTMERIDKLLSPERLSVGWNVREVDGVPYVHCHIIPRYADDGGKVLQSLVTTADIEIDTVAKLFQQ